jgi:hypothetical protein
MRSSVNTAKRSSSLLLHQVSCSRSCWNKSPAAIFDTGCSFFTSFLQLMVYIELDEGRSGFNDILRCRIIHNATLKALLYAIRLLHSPLGFAWLLGVTLA